LGTPLSSLIGWVEYLKSSPEKTGAVVPDMERDLSRLQKVTNRFSKIGSIPDFKEENLKSIIDEIFLYFKRRLPGGEEKIRLTEKINQNLPPLLLNRDLLSWVLENLIRNAVDAMEGNEGSISITVDFLNEHQIYIDVQDSGKGIPPRERKNIFKPGFSTKRRGWGLGLSLTKRIIEEYHGGKVQLKDSQVGSGSTFRIILDVNRSRNGA